MLNTLILGIGILAAAGGISVATWSILRTRSILRAHQQNDRVEKIAGKLYLVVIDMLIRMSPDQLSPDNVQPFEHLPEETKGMYRELAKHYFADLE